MSVLEVDQVVEACTLSRVMVLACISCAAAAISSSDCSSSGVFRVLVFNSPIKDPKREPTTFMK